MLSALQPNGVLSLYFKQFTRCFFSCLLQSNPIKGRIYDAPPHCPSRAHLVCSTVCALVIMFQRIVPLRLGGRWVRVGHTAPATHVSRANIGYSGDKTTPGTRTERADVPLTSQWQIVLMN